MLDTRPSWFVGQWVLPIDRVVLNTLNRPKIMPRQHIELSIASHCFYYFCVFSRLVKKRAYYLQNIFYQPLMQQYDTNPQGTIRGNAVDPEMIRAVLYL